MNDPQDLDRPQQPRRRSSGLLRRAPARERPEKPSKASWQLRPGDEIAEGRSVLDPLGGGRRYEVYLAWDERLLSLTVAKIIRPDQADDVQALADLAQEAEILDRLAHPVLLRAFDAVLDGRHPHLLLEHLDGITLRKLISAHGRLPLEQFLPLALQMAAVLHYISSEGYVHLDVKPSNIVMGVPPRLIDLSLARSLKFAAEHAGSIGTDAYAAPEQCGNGVGRIGSAADVWGLGATLYHAIAGEPPYEREPGARDSDDPAVRFPQLVYDPSPLPNDVPAPLETLIMDMLAEDAADRPTAAEVASELEQLIDPRAAA